MFFDNILGDPFVENFFVDTKTGSSFFDLVSNDIPVWGRTDTNRDLGDLTRTGASGDGELLAVATNELNNSTRFQVPEPGILVLLGTGLLVSVQRNTFFCRSAAGPIMKPSPVGEERHHGLEATESGGVAAFGIGLAA